MKEGDKTAKQLVNELAELRQRIAELESLETDRKQAEEALRESEERYRALFEQELDGVLVVDETGKLLLANRAAAEIGGFDSVEELLEIDLLDFVAPEERERAASIMAEDMFEKNLGRFNEFRCVKKSGEETWISAVGVLIEYKGKKAGLTSFRDITAQKRAQEALQASERMLRLIFESIADGITVSNLDGNIIQVNDAVVSMQGYNTREELIGRNTFESIAQKDHPRAGENLEKTLKKGRSGTIEYTLLKKDRSEFPAELSASVLSDADGNAAGFVAITRDITERKQAEDALRESEERYRALVNLGGTVGEAIVMLQDNEQGNAVQVFVSNEWPRITGYSRKELLGMSFFDLLHPRYRESSRARHKRKMSGEIIPALFEMSIIKKDGTEVPIELTSAYTTYKGEHANVAFIRDITERKQAEEREKQLQAELLQSSRLASIGELAAGVAHEINNPLTGVIGFSQRLLRKSTNEEDSRYLESIYREAWRAAKVVENLLAFARRRETKRQYADINEILGKTLELRAYELRTGNIDLVVELTPGLPKTRVDFQQIEQVFLNLILNAEQAITEANRAGKLSIKTQKMDGRIRISFADNGPGMSAETLDKVFDPFFTTRDQKGGTGLGLSLCHGIVTDHGGKIYARSKPGQGSTFFIELPLAPGKASGKT